jgi:hypothetical protein
MSWGKRQGEKGASERRRRRRNGGAGFGTAASVGRYERALDRRRTHSSVAYFSFTHSRVRASA